MADLVLYDGDCAFCSSAARFAQKKVSPKLDYQPYQFAELGNYGLTATQCQNSLHYVSETKKVYQAQNAVAQILISGKLFWRPLGYLIKLPIINQFAQLGYYLVAKYRDRLPGGTPTCKLDRN